MNKTVRKFVQSFLRDFTTFGGFPFSFLVLAFIFLLQEWTLFFQTLWGIIFIMMIVVGIRIFYFKNRPKKEAYHNFIEKIDASSFPSLHTARAAFLTLIFSNYLRNYLLISLLIISALLTAYSRIYLKKHDLYDVFGGLILGVIAFGLVLLV